MSLKRIAVLVVFIVAYALFFYCYIFFFLPWSLSLAAPDPDSPYMQCRNQFSDIPLSQVPARCVRYFK